MSKNRKTPGLSRRAAYLRGKLLEKRRMLLENMVSGFKATIDTSARVPTDLADMADAAMAREMSCEIGTVESNAVTQIDHALERLDKGTYGKCEDCGKRIGDARLKILPFADLCVDCKAREEREGLMKAEEEFSWEDIDEIIGSEGESGAAEVASIERGRRPG